MEPTTASKFRDVALARTLSMRACDASWRSSMKRDTRMDVSLLSLEVRWGTGERRAGERGDERLDDGDDVADVAVGVALEDLMCPCVRVDVGEEGAVDGTKRRRDQT